MQAKQKVPDGWRLELLDNLAKRGSGHTPDKTKSDYWNGGIKWISLADSSQLDNGYIHTTDKEISTVGLKNSSAVLHPAETVVLSRDAGVGKSAVMAAPMAVSQHFMAWQCDNQHTLNSWFLYYWLQMMKPEFERQAVGSTIKTIGLPYFKKLRVLAPSYTEQTKIAQILSTWDKAIATTERLLANSQQQKQALMQQLLTGQKRFAGFTDEWITVEFDELLGIEIGGTPSRSNPAYWDTEKTTNNRWLSIADLKGNLITDTSEYISDLGAAKSNTKLIPAGTIVMSFKLTIGRRAILAADTYTNEAICAFKIKDPKRLSNDFLFHALCLVNFEKDIDQAVKGKTLNKAKLKQLTLSLPSLIEQQKIAQVLSTADAKITNLQAQLATLKLEKKALMQQLLTGQRRVKLDADAAA